MFYVDSGTESTETSGAYTKIFSEWSYCVDGVKPTHCPLTYFSTDSTGPYLFAICYQAASP
jgi:hypothetical protein